MCVCVQCEREYIEGDIKEQMWEMRWESGLINRSQGVDKLLLERLASFFMCCEKRKKL